MAAPSRPMTVIIALSILVISAWDAADGGLKAYRTSRLAAGRPA